MTDGPTVSCPPAFLDLPGERAARRTAPTGAGVFRDSIVGAVLRAALLCGSFPGSGPPAGRPLRVRGVFRNSIVGAVLRAARLCGSFLTLGPPGGRPLRGAVGHWGFYRRGGATRRPFVRFFSDVRAARRTAPTGAGVFRDSIVGAVLRAALLCGSFPGSGPPGGRPLRLGRWVYLGTGVGLGRNGVIFPRFSAFPPGRRWPGW